MDEPDQSNKQKFKTNYWDCKFGTSFQKLCLDRKWNIDEILVMNNKNIAKLTGVSERTVSRHGGSKYLSQIKLRAVEEIGKRYDEGKILKAGGENKAKAIFGYAKKNPFIFEYIIARNNVTFMQELMSLYRDEMSESEYLVFCMNVMLKMKNLMKNGRLDEDGEEILREYVLDYVYKIRKESKEK